MTIWKIGVDTKNNLKFCYENYYCAQGWEGFDLSWIYYNQKAHPDQRDSDYVNLLESNNIKRLKIHLWGKDTEQDKKAKNAWKNLFEISPDDIIILYHGNDPKYIGQMPKEFEYYYAQDAGEYDAYYFNTLFPIKYTPVDNIDTKIISAGRMGVKGIEAYGGNISDLKNAWSKFKSNNEFNPNIFPTEIQEKFNRIKLDKNQKIKESKKQIMEEINKASLSVYIDLLENNKNLILTGAPGTGKTHLAKEIAREITGSDNDDSHQIEFLQFHPSFDYTDFVEGLRPIKKEGKDEIGFELKDGIFRKFCDAARKDSNSSYVIIIDEINRADISKVFGELFFSIDKGYRGNRGSVKTQYANLREEDDQLFFVPDNVHIIGAMNDIDRSVESFDFAIRRRFAWKKITPEERKSMLDVEIPDWKEDAISKMDEVNAIIKDNPELGEDFQIGPAYFLRLNEYEGDFTKLWDMHLAPLLNEYLRGLPNKTEILEELENAYEPKSN